MSRPGPAPEFEDVVVRVYGPEPIGAAQSRGLLGNIVATTGPNGTRGAFRRGATGDPARTASGDLGALQSFAAVRTSGSKNSFRKGDSTALPSTSGGTIQDKLGELGI